MNYLILISINLFSSISPLPPSLQVKKAEIRTLLQNIDKETAATVTYDEFLDMAAPKVANRDEREEIQKVRVRRGTGVGEHNSYFLRIYLPLPASIPPSPPSRCLPSSTTMARAAFRSGT